MCRDALGRTFLLCCPACRRMRPLPAVKATRSGHLPMRLRAIQSRHAPQPHRAPPTTTRLIIKDVGFAGQAATCTPQLDSDCINTSMFCLINCSGLDHATHASHTAHPLNAPGACMLAGSAPPSATCTCMHRSTLLGPASEDSPGATHDSPGATHAAFAPLWLQGY